MKLRRMFPLLVCLLTLFAIAACSKNVPLGRYVAADDKSDYVELLQDNKMRIINGGYLFATFDYKVAGNKVAVGGGGRWEDHYQIEDTALVELGTRRRFVHQ